MIAIRTKMMTNMALYKLHTVVPKNIITKSSRYMYSHVRTEPMYSHVRTEPTSFTYTSVNVRSSAPLVLLIMKPTKTLPRSDDHGTTVLDAIHLT